MSTGISVIICCYNSSRRLPRTLEHLAKQKVPAHVSWEIIVVDNASDDGTAVIAREEWVKYDRQAPGFVVLSEPKPGKNYAFKKAIFSARYSYVLTCDDDNWLNPDYVARAFEIIESDPSIGALGGCGLFEPEQPMNKDIELWSNYFVNGPQTWAEKEHWVYGAGSVYRKNILIDRFNRGWQQITSGRKGTSLIGGEDVEICFMIYLSGYKVIADDRLVFKHFVPLKRQQIAYIKQLSFWLAYSHVLLNSYFPLINQDERHIRDILNKWLAGATRTFLKNLVFAGYKKVKVWQRPRVEDSLSFNNIYGTWCALFKNRRLIIEHHKRTKALLENRTA